MKRAAAFILAAALGGPAAMHASADDVKIAGTDVPAPRRTKFVAPAYPAEAQMRGLRGIVILELVINEQGKVATADVVRSVPPFDEAALTAARQWEYEITQLNGEPVRVRVTVPITFALKLPEMSRAEGVPEMRQGAAPGFPPGGEGPARVVADVTLQPDGSVSEAIVKSGESPWAEGLLLAIRTWKFASASDGSAVTFTVQADYISPGRPGQPPKVDLKLSDPKRQPGVGPVIPAPVEVPTPMPGMAPSPAAASTGSDEATPATPATSPAPATTPMPAPVAAPAEPPTPLATPAPPAASPTPNAPAAPEEEIIGGPVATPPPPPPLQPGFSAVRDVTLGLGVPDLVKGRRPVVPPIARMASRGGEVRVTFSVDAAGVVSLQKVEGEDLLKEAARQAVASWSFRRTSAERMFLAAVFTFEGDTAKAEVRQPE